MNWIADAPGGCRLQVRVTPRAAQHRVEGVTGDALRIRLAAPPVEGKANEALVEFLADALDLPRRAVQLEAGERGRTKRLFIAGRSSADTAARLGQR